MKEIDVIVTEVYQRKVRVKAFSPGDAETLVEQRWLGGEFSTRDIDFVSVKVQAMRDQGKYGEETN